MSKKCLVTFNRPIVIPMPDGPVCTDSAICNVPDNFREYDRNRLEIVGLAHGKDLTKTLFMVCGIGTVSAYIELD